MAKYGMRCKFDVELHKKYFPDSLSILILSDGSVEYAYPSATAKLIQIDGHSEKQIRKECPREYKRSIDLYLCYKLNCIYVNREHITPIQLTKDQLSTLRQLRSEGIFVGKVPNYPTK